MIEQVLKSTSHTFRLVADLAAAPASATAEVRNAAGDLIDSGAATVDSVNTTVATVTDSQSFTVASASGIQPGRRYLLIRTDGAVAAVRVARVSGTTITLTDAPAVTPEVGFALKGLEVSYVLSSSYTSTAALNFWLDWRITDTAGVVVGRRTVFDVVLQQIEPPVTAERAKAFTVPIYAGHVLNWSEARWAELAAGASEDVLVDLRRGGRRAHLVGDGALFEPAGLSALRARLADFGLCPQGVADIAAYQEQQRKAMRRQVLEAVEGMAFYDSDDSGSIEEPQETWPPFTVLVRR